MVANAVALPEGKVKNLHQNYTQGKAFEMSVEDSNSRSNVPSYPDHATEEEHKKWLESIYQGRLGVCRHRVMAFFYKAVQQDINPEDLRIVSINGNHVIIEAKVKENWYQLDLGGGSATITKGEGKLQPATTQETLIDKTKGPLTELKAEEKAEIGQLPEEAKADKKDESKTAQQQKNQNKFNKEFSSALGKNNSGNIFIADASNIDEGKVGSAFNVAVAMLSKDLNLKDSLFIVNSPVDLDLTSDQLVINGDKNNLSNNKPAIYRGGKLLEFVNSNAGNKTIIVNWQNFSEQQKVAYNSLLDKVQMIDGKEISPAIKVISVENSGNGDLSFTSRHQKRMVFNSSDSQDFVAKNYPKISNDNASANNPVTLEVDIAGLNDYKQVLFGRVKINQEQQLEYDESPFVKSLSGQNNGTIKVIIKNLKDDKKQELEQRIALAKSCGYFNYFGKKIPCPTNLEIEFASKTFDFTAIKNSITKLSENQIFSPEHRQDYHLINPHIFEQLIVNAKTEGDKYIETEGLIKQNTGKTLKLYIANNLADNQYYYLFSKAKESNVKLDLALAQDVKLPQAILDNFNQKPEVIKPKKTEEDKEGNINEDIYEHPNNALGDSHIGTINNRLVLKKPNTYSKIYLSKDQNQSQKIVAKLKEKKRKLHIINVEDLTWQQDFIAKSCEKTRDDNNNLQFTNFSDKEGEIITELRKGKNIALKGEFSEDLLSILQPIILKTGDYKDFGNLSLIIENKDKTAVKQCFSCLSENNIIDSALKEQQIKEEAKEKSTVTESFNQEISATDFIARRLELLTSNLAKEPMVRLTGHSGVGKTSLVKTLAKDKQDEFNLHYEMSKLEDWAHDTTANKTKILFIDEANIDNFHYTTFNPLKEAQPQQGRIEIYYQGKFYQLTKDHKVVFAGNPNSYGGGRAEQKLFANNSVKEIELKDFSKSYIYEQLLKAEIFDKLPKDFCLIAEEDFKSICEAKIAKYQQQKAQNPNIKNQDTVRELQENVLLAIKNPPPTQEELREIKNSNYITTKATKEKENQLADFIAIRKQNQQQNITAGLNGFLIYGPSGIGKSEMARAILEHNGYKLHQNDPENDKNEAQNQSNSPTKEYCYIQSSLSLARKKELIITAFENNWPIMIDEINSCADDGLEKVLNSALTGYHPENGEKKEDNGFFMIATANRVSAQTQDGRKNLSPAIVHRCNTIDLEPLTNYKEADIEKIIKHQKEHGLINKTTEITEDLVSKIQQQIQNSKINLRNLSDWVNKDFGYEGIEVEERPNNVTSLNSNSINYTKNQQKSLKQQD